MAEVTVVPGGMRELHVCLILFRLDSTQILTAHLDIVASDPTRMVVLHVSFPYDCEI